MRTTTWVTLAAAVALAGCSNSNKGLSVSATSRGSTTTGAGGAATATIDAGNGLSIDRLRMVVQKVEVEGPAACAAPTGPSGPSGPSGPTGPTGTGRVAGLPSAADHGGSGSSGSGDDGDSDGGECEIEGGPFLVDLAGDTLTGAVHWVATVDVPFGTYQEVKFKVNTVPASAAGTDAGLLAMADAHASILVDGTRSTTVNGVATTAPFSFSTPMEVAQKREGSIVVAEGTNVTLDVDPSGWFKAADGSLLDPADPTARGAIEANIRASIRVLHDDDEDGHDDGDHGGGPDDGAAPPM